MISYFIPVVVIIIIIYGLYKKIDIFDTFLIGVKEGMKISINLFPTIFAMIIAINVLLGSGIIVNISNILSGIFDYLKGKIVIVISHRFNNKKLFDRVIKIKDGKIIEI